MNRPESESESNARIQGKSKTLSIDYVHTKIDRYSSKGRERERESEKNGNGSVLIFYCLMSCGRKQEEKTKLTSHHLVDGVSPYWHVFSSELACVI